MIKSKNYDSRLLCCGFKIKLLQPFPANDIIFLASGLIETTLKSVKISMAEEMEYSPEPKLLLIYPCHRKSTVAIRPCTLCQRILSRLCTPIEFNTVKNWREDTIKNLVPFQTLSWYHGRKLFEKSGQGVFNISKLKINPFMLLCMEKSYHK